MAKCALSDALDTGATADIFYDAIDHEDEAAADTIDNFQTAVSDAARELRQIAELDLTGENLSPQDFETLRALQARITDHPKNKIET